ncbi:bifunctional phosphopantothenoylcysteine decarboxylase/phosphopantothenate--cysteine ligase CoaBC [Hirschia baltica]|uniref:Coenzyme A biosynthesis bifunctional protein CoaBC n=1 Tax=Hirschia baltica (strain ATCC 49814 / DSM 5838 / IFAM 1418) TaxID=582402 RepID=C6XRV3_HIRBI|nr:bifunctional phosphopantothenoylcysteine decarboxylase/phosphopantothenate--cysteine ligase CoaBC [Hirschia baltica]ACT60713.1 phosphopantothenoylcysteine decarboxylase/phosphopantothenate/cysteine ligase [Hirschia baltica ATCC 49814]
MADKSILLIIGGGIAAYKSLELIRELGRAGVSTRCILTKGGEQFVTPLTVSSLTGEKVFSELFDLDDEADMGHIQLSRSTDLVVVCPATADLMAKSCAGIANDLATTTLLATDKPVFMVPAMNVRMWDHPATQRNVRQLRLDGIEVMEPDIGEMACGEYGPGRLPDVMRIKDEILDHLARPIDAPLAGKKAVVTAGPTREALDPVRYISNHSSGRQGYAIASALSRLGADVTLVSGPTSLPQPAGLNFVQVETAIEMLDAVKSGLPSDIFVSVAAVADWRPAEPSDVKIKAKTTKKGMGSITLVENPDILKTISHMSEDRPKLVIGFAAETNDVEDHAQGKLERKGCDWIVANDVSGDVMGGAENEIAIVKRDGIERLPRMSKAFVAQNLAKRIAESFKD